MLLILQSHAHTKAGHTDHIMGKNGDWISVAFRRRANPNDIGITDINLNV